MVMKILFEGKKLVVMKISCRSQRKTIIVSAQTPAKKPANHNYCVQQFVMFNQVIRIQ